jgi:hypothetical protein
MLARVAALATGTFRSEPGQRRLRPRLDPQALEAIGIDLEEVRRRAEQSFGPGALDRTRAARRRRG